MKIRCIIKEGCNGAGYENFKFDEIRNLKKGIAELLISFSYAEPINKNDNNKDNDNEDNNNDNEDNNNDNEDNNNENNNQEGGEEKLLI